MLGSLTLTDSGGLVAFESVADDLVAGDVVPGSYDVFMRDPATNTTTVENLTTGGVVKANSVFSGDPVLTGDGSMIVFYSTAMNLAGEATEDADIFGRVFSTDTTTRLSLDSGGGEPDLPVVDPVGARFPDTTNSGLTTVYESDATDMVAGDGNGATDVFGWGAASPPAALMSQQNGGGGVEGDLESSGASISGDGTATAFTSTATNLVAGDSNGQADVFVREGTATERVSLTDGEGQAASSSFNADISGNGDRVVFASAAELAGGGSPDGRGTYLRDRVNLTTERIDVPSGPTNDDNNEVEADQPTISDDGRYVAFATDASTMVPNDTNGTTDVLVRDTLEDRTVRASIRTDGSETNRRSLTGTISGDGTAVAYATEDRGMVPGMGAEPYNPFYEAFLVELDWTRPQTTITAPAPAETTSSQVSTSFGSSEAASTFQCRVDSGAFSRCSSPFTTQALPLGAHNIEVRAVDRFGNADDSPAVTSFVINAPHAGAGSQQQDQVPPPEYRQTFNLEPVSGEVFVILPDGRRVRIETLTSIPQGSIVDARRGKVRLLVEEKDGTVSSTVWSQGMFKIVQLASGITECRLAGRLVEGPTARVSAASTRAHAAAKRRRLWGSGTGKFRTKGRFGSATVRGTRWLTEDRTNGTLILVRRGSVKVRDFVKKKTVVLKKGDRYFARKRKRR